MNDYLMYYSHFSLVNNHQKKEQTEFHNNGFVNEGLEADIGLPIEDIDPGKKINI